MSSTIIKGKYVLARVNGRGKVDIIRDGAVLQQDGQIIDVGDYESIKARYAADEEIGSREHLVLHLMG